MSKSNQEQCFVFGKGIAKFRDNQVPTVLDVMKNYFYIKKNVTVNDCQVRNNVCDRLIEQYNTVYPSVQLLSTSRITQKIKKSWEQRVKLQKSKKPQKIADFRKSCSSQIFEIRKLAPPVVKRTKKRREVQASVASFDPKKSIKVTMIDSEISDNEDNSDEDIDFE